MIVTALFTKSSGQPATGLTLSEIAIYLYARALADGTVTAIWSGENPTEEIGGGLYSKSYDADTTTYTYYAYAVYSGATELDTNYAVMAHPFSVAGTAGAGATTWPYTLTDGDTGEPIADADVWVSTDEAGENVIARGTTDQNGVVTFYLDDGSTVYVWRRKDGWTCTNPDVETVS